MKRLSITNSEVTKVVNFLRTMSIPSVIIYINGVKCIASLENEIAVLSLQIRYDGQLPWIKVDDNQYLDEEISRDICKQMGVEYTSKSSKQ